MDLDEFDGSKKNLIFGSILLLRMRWSYCFRFNFFMLKFFLVFYDSFSLDVSIFGAEFDWKELN